MLVIKINWTHRTFITSICEFYNVMIAMSLPKRLFILTVKIPGCQSVTQTKTVCTTEDKKFYLSFAWFSLIVCAFPFEFKHSSVTPLLKEPDLDPTVSANFWPISNLNNISRGFQFSKKSILNWLLLSTVHSTALVLNNCHLYCILTCNRISFALPPSISSPYLVSTLLLPLMVFDMHFGILSLIISDLPTLTLSSNPI